MSKLVSMVNKEKAAGVQIAQWKDICSVERHMLANQKVWDSIPSQGMPFLFCPVLIYTSFTWKLQGKTPVKNIGSS